MNKVLILTIFLYGCFDVKDMTPTLLNPKVGKGYQYTILESCPKIKASDPVEIPISEMSEYWCVPKDQAAKMLTEHENSCD